MTTLTLYYTPGTCAQAVRIALEEAGTAHHLVRVDFLDAEEIRIERGPVQSRFFYDQQGE